MLVTHALARRRRFWNRLRTMCSFWFSVTESTSWSKCLILFVTKVIAYHMQNTDELPSKCICEACARAFNMFDFRPSFLIRIQFVSNKSNCRRWTCIRDSHRYQRSLALTRTCEHEVMQDMLCYNKSIVCFRFDVITCCAFKRMYEQTSERKTDPIRKERTRSVRHFINIVEYAKANECCSNLIILYRQQVECVHAKRSFCSGCFFPSSIYESR